MAPKSTEAVGEPPIIEKKQAKHPMKQTVIWKNIIIMSLLHVGALYGLYIFLAQFSFKMFMYVVFINTICGLGITAGAHRLWSHRCYKAKLPLRILLAVLNTLAYQTCIYDWCRDHRVHHKFSETDADPHNIKRGFFFAHCGWLMVKKHPEVTVKGKNVDLGDLLSDPVIRYQRSLYAPMSAVSFVVTAMIPTLWGETAWDSFFVAGVMRYVYSLHCTWSVNSVAHLWGNRPYDLSLHATENYLVALGAIGEGWHNYHHAFPWDYATSELGWKMNFTTIFIDLMAKIGWAYDLKRASADMILKRKQRACKPDEERE